MPHAVPDPTMVTVTSDLASPISSDDDVTLTCTVELSTDLASISSMISVAVTWTGPSGMLQSSSVPVMSGTSPPTYTSTLLLSAVMSDGTYTCQAMTTSSLSYLLSSGSVSNDIMITIGKMIILRYRMLFTKEWLLFDIVPHYETFEYHKVSSVLFLNIPTITEAPTIAQTATMETTATTTETQTTTAAMTTEPTTTEMSMPTTQTPGQ